MAATDWFFNKNTRGCLPLFFLWWRIVAYTEKSKDKKLKILIAASEIVPFAKTGGLADVAGALPKALKKQGHDVRLVMPRYKGIDETKFGIKEKGAEVN